ncbi:MAG TPA: ATP-binding protein [Actinomycetota bacterium]|nr:ATP-binding protein [Actinomycetota bacterium]
MTSLLILLALVVTLFLYVAVRSFAYARRDGIASNARRLALSLGFVSVAFLLICFQGMIHQAVRRGSFDAGVQDWLFTWGVGILGTVTLAIALLCLWLLSRVFSKVHRDQSKLRETEHRYRALVEHVPAVLYIVPFDDSDDAYYVSPQIADLAGYPASEWAARSPGLWLDRVHPDDRDRVWSERCSARDSGTAFLSEYRLTHADGRELWIRDEAHLVDEEADKWWQGLMFDVTEDKKATEERFQLEARLHHAQRMEAVGQMAGGVAHDFNNLLSVVLTSCGFAQEAMPEGSEAYDDIGEARSAAQRGVDLVRQLLSFSRKEAIEPEVLDVSEVVRDFCKILQHAVTRSVEISTELDVEPALVVIDRGQLEQVLMNLVVNSRDAMAGTGRVSITTEAQVQVRREEALVLGLSEGFYVKLSVADVGPGMDDETRRRIFEPFFTTKERGSGTGLGLANVYRIVDAANGHIVVNSQLGLGTTFSIYIPSTREAAPASVIAVKGTVS